MTQDEDLTPYGIDLYDFDDFPTQRRLLYDSVQKSVAEQFPLSHGGVRVELDQLEYEDPEDYSLADQKKAVLGNKYLKRRLRGSMRLWDEQTGELLDEKRTTLMSVPYLTQRGTFIHNGNEIGSIRQGRLLPGPYSRRQANGLLETQVSARVGTGKAYRVSLEPSTGVYRMKLGQSNLHLYSLLKDLGTKDDQLEQSWGTRVLDLNRKKYDPRVLDKAWTKLLPAYRRDEQATREQRVEQVREALEEMQVHERVMRKNLPNWFDRQKAASWAEQGEELMEKSARWIKTADFSKQDLQTIVWFLNDQHQAGIPDDLPRDQLEEQILLFVEQTGTPVSPQLMEAGRQGLQQVQRQAPSLPPLDPPEFV